jgi:hypothetical protein
MSGLVAGTRVFSSHIKDVDGWNKSGRDDAAWGTSLLIRR